MSVRLEAEVLMDSKQSIVMVDCLVNVDKGRLEAGWVAFQTGNHPPTVVLTNGKVDAEIELPISRRHFAQDVMQYDASEPIFFKLTPQFIKRYRGNREL